MSAPAVSDGKRAYGVHEWVDRHGNCGTEILGQEHFKVSTIRFPGLFEIDLNKARNGLARYFDHQGRSKRKVFVVVDGDLPRVQRDQISGFFEWCKKEVLLQDYRVISLDVSPSDKTLHHVSKILRAANECGLKRRDLFLGIGKTIVTDVVGFAAATFRRSTPWIRVPTDPLGVISCSEFRNSLSLDHVDAHGTTHSALLGISHPPVASLYDPSFVDSSSGFVTGSSETFRESSIIQDIRYHVVSVSKIFSPKNRTLMDDYCIDSSKKQKRNLLVIVDDYPSCPIADIEQYFESFASEIGRFCILPMNVSSAEKNMESVARVLDAAIGLDMVREDLFVVVGGGTIMDVVGFAAAMYKGGSSYLRIPTTLVGMIDAGVGVKVGVNFGTHKNQMGSYYAPVACLNDPQTFLATLPRREFACGLAESIKMALIKSPRLFELNWKYHRDLEYNKHTPELIYISIRTMLEELQPNLREHSLIRLVDFGHEFGHIIESLAKNQIPHGECVAIGMAVSSTLAHMRGVFSRSELNSTLNCMLNLGLPLYTMEYDCCNPETLWRKISTEGIEHKDGMLWLAIPEKIGKGGFIDRITDINAEMVHETILSLKRYQEEYKRKNALNTNDFATSDCCIPEDTSVDKDFGSSLLPKSEAISSSSSDSGDTNISSPPNGLDTGRTSPTLIEEHLATAAVTGPSGIPQTSGTGEKGTDPDRTPPANQSRGGASTPACFKANETNNGNARSAHHTEAENQARHSGTDSRSDLERPNVIVVDVGATYLRVGAFGPEGRLLYEPVRAPSPSHKLHVDDTLAAVQERLLDTVAYEVDGLMTRHSELSFEEVGISFGAVITREGIVQDASVLWNETARGYDFRKALQERLPGLHLTVLNDVSAAAWRYKDWGRFCLITVSSGLSNKVFNPDLQTPDRLDLDRAGIAGEMGHVVVEPRAVDELVQHAISQAVLRPALFECSKVNDLVQGDAQKIEARHLSLAVKAGDEFALEMLAETGVPYCPCGNFADLCSYSSGRGALRLAKKLAARGNHGVTPDEVTDRWLQQSIAEGHPLALKVLYDATYPLALRILQLAADIGLEQFLIVGGFAMKTGKSKYLETLQNHLARLCHQSAYFGGWSEQKIRGLVKFGIDDDNDGLIGIGQYVHHLRARYHAVEKAVGAQDLSLVTRPIPRCGAEEVLAKVVFSGICTTDMQILRGERGHEPTVLGHEGVCEVLKVGTDVKGVEVGDMVVLNPNNPLDDFDKIGHTREGVWQEFIKFGREFIQRKQVLNLGRSAVSTSDTLIEPLSCAVAAQERIKDRLPGKNVLVIGAGMMGLMFTILNTKSSARQVFLANRSRERLDFAVSRGIISESNVFTIGEDMGSQVARVSAGAGVDIVICCVSLGQGVSAVTDAFAYVNPGGCIYLFAGFRAGNLLVSDEGDIDAWSIRTGWKTQRIHVKGKPIDLSGHRGCRNEDLARAAEIIRADSLSFGRMVSHIVSLESLPDAMRMVTRDGKVNGVPAKRIVIDMAAAGRVNESAEHLPLRHLHQAARKHQKAISTGNLFREIGFDGGDPVLGWVFPPTWQGVKSAVESALQLKSIGTRKHFVWIGTGSWGFLVDALKHLTPVPEGQDISFHTLQTLDPLALADLLASIENLSSVLCLGVSQSGTTLETVLLMSALRECFDGHGLDYREHFVWLTDTRKPHRIQRTGEDVIRSREDHNWKEVDTVPLTVGSHSDINALFCAPHSMMTLLPLFLLLDKNMAALQQIYREYLVLKDDVVRGILSSALSVALRNKDQIQLILDDSLVPILNNLVTQLIEQSLGSKQVGFNPRVSVGKAGQEPPAGVFVVALPMPAEASSTAVKMMLTMNALSVFVAMVAYHRRITFVTHPKVNLYKRRADKLMVPGDTGSQKYLQQQVTKPDQIGSEVGARTSHNPAMRFVEVLCYGHSPVFDRTSLPGRHSVFDGQGIKDSLHAHLPVRKPGIIVNMTPAEQWNHSRYQAAVQREDTLFVVLVSSALLDDDGIPAVHPFSKQTIERNVKTMRSIAIAVHETLAPNSMFFKVEC